MVGNSRSLLIIMNHCQETINHENQKLNSLGRAFLVGVNLGKCVIVDCGNQGLLVIAYQQPQAQLRNATNPRDITNSCVDNVFLLYSGEKYNPTATYYHHTLFDEVSRGKKSLG